MDFDPSQHTALLASLLLIPGLVFLFVVVIYVAFAHKSSPAKRIGGEPRTCLKCGRALLPDQLECPTCQPQPLPPPMAPEADAEAQPPPVEEAVVDVEIESEASAPDTAASSHAYEGEIVDETEPPRKDT